MADTAKLLVYAVRFEETYADDNWERLEEFFTDDAHYSDSMGEARGRKAVLEYMKNSLDSIDRTFDERVLLPTGALRSGEDWVEFDFEVTYRSPGKEDLFMRGIHRAEFIGERIHKLAVRILP
ncbi:MAG: nuclear transport factor 2 family protein [Pseudomonadota bacterium]